MRPSALAIIPLAFFLAACKEKPPDREKPDSGTGTVEKPAGRVEISPDLIHGPAPLTDDQGLAGRRLALQHCQRCHLFVEPEALPKVVWKDFVFPRMGAFMGMPHVGVNPIVNLGRSPAERDMILQSGLYPPTPEMTLDHWETMVAYYLEHAPDALPKPANPPAIASTTGMFTAAPFGYRQLTPNTTLVYIDEAGKRLLVGDMTSSSLSILDAKLNRTQKIGTNSAPVHARFSGEQLWLTTIGSVAPSDLPEGELIVLEEKDRFFGARRQQSLAKLRRPTHASYADLNGDGLTDLLVSEYGHQLGSFNYYEARKDGSYRKIPLSPEPGSMSSHLLDFNNDGLLDVAVVHGQQREGVHIHYNRGDGSFASSYALPVPPTYGSASIAFYDFNGDGLPDILATNGDNGDYQPVLKPHHGVRIYLNDGKNAFEERYFFPMNGAFKALAEDFDLDGDLDIAAISMFPDFQGRPEEGFVYLENTGGLEFAASSIARVREGRWLCMDTGDLDGDGDKDIVLGSFTQGPGIVPTAFHQAWQRGALPGLVLWNQTR